MLGINTAIKIAQIIYITNENAIVATKFDTLTLSFTLLINCLCKNIKRANNIALTANTDFKIARSIKPPCFQL